MGVGAGLPALHGDKAVRVCAGHVCGEIQIEEFIPEGESVRCIARGTGADRESLVRARPIERKFGLEHLGIRAGLCALANGGGRIIQPNPITHNESWRSGAKRPKGLSFAAPHGKLSRHAFREQYRWCAAGVPTPDRKLW